MTCCCSLPYTNPDSCKMCPNKPIGVQPIKSPFYIPPIDNILQVTKFGRNQLKRVRDIFGDDGKLKQRTWEYETSTFPFISTTYSDVGVKSWSATGTDKITVTY